MKKYNLEIRFAIQLLVMAAISLIAASLV